MFSVFELPSRWDHIFNSNWSQLPKGVLFCPRREQGYNWQSSSSRNALNTRTDKDWHLGSAFTLLASNKRKSCTRLASINYVQKAIKNFQPAFRDSSLAKTNKSKLTYVLKKKKIQYSQICCFLNNTEISTTMCCIQTWKLRISGQHLEKNGKKSQEKFSQPLLLLQLL